MPGLMYLPTTRWGYDTCEGDITHGIGYSLSLYNRNRYRHEIASVWSPLQVQDLSPANAQSPLSPEEIGHCLKATYELLNNPELSPAKTAASTTIYDGRGNIITATLGNSPVFAAAFNHEGIIIGVMLLNKPGLTLNTLDTEITIHSIEAIAEEFQVTLDQIATMHIISTTRGFITCVDGGDPGDQEQYLLDILDDMGCQHGVSEQAIAKLITEQARSDGSKLNVGCMVQRLNEPSLHGTYTGEGYFVASVYAAENVTSIFKQQCSLSRCQSARQKKSVNKTSQPDLPNQTNSPAGVNSTLDNIDFHLRQLRFFQGEQPILPEETTGYLDNSQNPAGTVDIDAVLDDCDIDLNNSQTLFKYAFS